jgi:hypothetical protein
MGARVFSSRSVRASRLVLTQRSVHSAVGSHPTVGRERWLLARVVGRAQLGHKRERRLETTAQGATCANLAVGRKRLQANCFSCYFFYRNSLLIFAQILGKFHIVFSIQIIPTKNLFREFKSDINFSVKYKVNEFFNSLFLLQIFKVIA